jgi:phosphoglycerol transferase MdoB-like AlkP superfamily enzyme
VNVSLLKILLKRLLLVYGIYSISRIIFFLFNFSYFKTFPFSEILVAFCVGLRFDTTAIIYTNSLIILLHLMPIPWKQGKLYQQITMWIFIAINLIALLFNLIDAGYFTFSGKRSGVELFSMGNDIADQSLVYIKDYWYLVLLLAGAGWLMYKYYPRLPTTKDQPAYTFKTFLTECLTRVIAAGICFGAARGSLGLKPLNVLDAARLTRTELAALTLNTPFQLIMTVQQTGVAEKNYMSQAEANNIFNPVHQYSSVKPSGKNIVLIIIESLGKEYTGFYNNGKGYTPFLDSLMLHSTVFMNAYANGKRSIEGIPSLVASMPSLMDNDYMNSYYQANALQSTGACLQGMGYDASFYHGGKNGTMSFDNFIAATGAGTYFGLNQYPDMKDDDGSWGIYDEPYLQYFAQELGQKKAPFFSTVFTLSSHHPYNIPAGRKGMFADGTLPIHKTIRYTDYSLRRFFETARTQSWYNNTLFVITADHSSTNESAKYSGVEGMYEIPMAIFDPANPRQQVIDKTVQQIDLMPTMLFKAGYSKPFFSFGANALDSTGNGWAVQYVNNQYQLVQYPFVLHFDGEKTTGFFNANDKGLLKASSDETIRHFMENNLKAIIQQYNAALIHNKTMADH